MNRGLDLVKAYNYFYTKIHKDFSMKVPPLMSSREEVKLKLQLVKAGGDTQLALKLLIGLQDKDDDRSPRGSLFMIFHSLRVPQVQRVQQGLLPTR